MYIHERIDWPNFTWDKNKIETKLIHVSKAAGYLEGRLSVIGFGMQQLATVEALTHDIVSSYEIEGVLLNLEQVRSSVARRMGVQIANEKESSHYVEGVVEMMLDAVNHFAEPLTEERIFGWHNCLFPTGRSATMPINVGKYRVEPMDIISGAWGREKVHYHAPEASKVPHEMHQFLNWYNANSTQKDFIKSAIAHFWFVSIHPFDDGNGRISRAIADMALSQADNSAFRYFSISHQINKEKRKYYEILELCQKGTCDITLWIEWYLDCMLRAIESSEDMLSSILNKAKFWQYHSQTVLNDRQRMVLNIYLDGYKGKLTTKKWAKLSKTSADTAARDIKQLVDLGVLIPQEGILRNVPYTIVISNELTYTPGPEDNDE